jgi:hypothetical protein
MDRPLVKFDLQGELRRGLSALVLGYSPTKFKNSWRRWPIATPIRLYGLVVSGIKNSTQRYERVGSFFIKTTIWVEAQILENIPVVKLTLV